MTRLPVLTLLMFCLESMTMVRVPPPRPPEPGGRPLPRPLLPGPPRLPGDDWGGRWGGPWRMP